MPQALKLVSSTTVRTEHVNPERIDPDFFRVEGPFLMALDAQPIHDDLRRSEGQEMNDRTTPVESKPAAAPADERAAFVKYIGCDRPETEGVAVDAWDYHRKTWLAALTYARAAASPAASIPAGWKLVPIEPTESMVVEGFESWPDQFFSDPEVWAAYEKMTGCQKAAHKARLCYAAMLAAAPLPVSQPAAAPWRGACEHTTANTACRICREKHGEDFDRRSAPSPADERAAKISDYLNAPGMWAQVYCCAVFVRGCPSDVARSAADAAVKEFGDAACKTVADLTHTLDEVLRVN
ncbi:hypothetical protein [Burkholderia multivorans]|uniref:hypothetical protein n=1 Tax=Burkholderia multivorans TaxID=87883 RepID=UPI0020B18B66|nr:hypothetical protein [Burkholderia multivorans]